MKQISIPKLGKKTKMFLLIFFLVSAILISLYLWITRPINNKNIDANNLDYFIAHAGGGMDGHIYTNSKEAVHKSIAIGFKFIELDLYLSQDNNLLCIHDLLEFNKMTNTNNKSLSINTKEFKSRIIYEKYTPLTLNEILQIQNKASFVLVIDKVSKSIILNRFIKPERRGKVYVEALSSDDYYNLLADGYKPMLALYKNKIIRYLYLLLIHQHKIEWIVTSADTEKDFSTLRLLKRLFGVKIAFFAPPDHLYPLGKHIGNEIDLLYTDYFPIVKEQ